MVSANKLKKLRMEKGFTQDEMGEAIGRVRSSYNRYETGKAQIPDELAEALAAKLGVEVSELYDDEAKEKKPVKKAPEKAAEKAEEKAEEKATEKEEKKQEAAKAEPFDLKAFRMDLDLTLKQLAEVAGKSLTSVRDYESGKTKIPQDVMEKLEAYAASIKEQKAEKAKAAKEEKTKARKDRPVMKKTKPAPAEAPVKKEETSEAKVEAPENQAEEENPPLVIIQNDEGQSISYGDILAKVAAVAPTVDVIYVKPGDWKAYWVKGNATGSVQLW